MTDHNFNIRKWALSKKKGEDDTLGLYKYLTLDSNADEHSCSSETSTEPLFRQPKRTRSVSKSDPNLSTETGKVATGKVATSDCSSYPKTRLRHHRKCKEYGVALESEFVKDKTIDVVEIDAEDEPISMEVEATDGNIEIVEPNNNGLQVDIANAHLFDNISDDQQEGNHYSDNNQQPSSTAAKSNLSKGESPVNPETSGTVKEVDKTAVKQTGLKTEALVNWNTLLDDELAWPFLKKSPVWKAVENFDVFKVTPQRPHFRPLNETKKEFREGLAIGLMVTFSNTYESIFGLVYDHPNEKFEQILESLNDLHTHGFDVVFLRDRVNLLMSLKSKHELLLSRVEDAEKEKSKKLSEKENYIGKLQELERRREELEKLFADTISKKQEKDIEVDQLQLYVDTVNKKIQKAIYEFNVNVAR